MTRSLSTRPLAMALAGVVAAAALLPTAAAAPFQDVLVQPPSIGQPQRGSLAGDLARLSFGAADLARGAFSLPLGIDAPAERGPLLASVFPAYSAEGGISEWGMGWGSDPLIRRHRLVGELRYDDLDGYTSPWGRLERGSDGAYYPAGLRSVVRLRQAAGAWTAETADGTVYTFAAADAVTTASGTYAWLLTRVDTLLGDSTHLHYEKNASGRAFLARVTWGGRHDGTQVQAELVYEPLPRPFVSYASGERLLLDRRVKDVVIRVKHGAQLVERWRHELGYTTSPLSPAFYLTSVTKRYASGEREPSVTYDYELGTEQLASARLAHEPALDLFLVAAGGAAIQPDHASMTDMEQNGLTDLEHYYTHTLVRRTETGYAFEALPARTGAENPLCRPAPSTLNKPRLLARMRGDLADPQVVVVRKNGVGATSTITLCDRAGMTQAAVTVAGAWELGASVRLADVDLDQRPDLVRVWSGGVQVLWNASTATTWAFLPGSTQALSPAVTATASWILDMNGDARPDLMSRTSSGVLVWYGKGGGRFEPVGKPMVFRTIAGTTLSGLGDYQFSHDDFNGDGLSDMILSKGQTALVYLNQGDELRQVAVPGLGSIPFAFGYPVIGDLTGSGESEVVFVDGTRAQVIALSTAGTGLLRRADDGKGTQVSFTYARVRPEPGIVHRYALLAGMTLDAAGQGAVTYRYTYGQPVWHSVGRFLVGFATATRESPLLREEVRFINDDDVSGVVVGSTAQDARTAGLERFSVNDYEPASFHGVPWRRLLGAESGHRGVGPVVAPPLSTRVAYVAHERELCPVITTTTLPDATLTRQESLASVAGLDDELHCLPASQRLVGTHADAALDFEHALHIERDAFGQVTHLAQEGPDGPLVLQDNVYDGDGRLLSSTAPGRGATTAAYDGLGRLVQVVAPNGVVMRIAAIDPVTDAVHELTSERGGTALARYGYAYDGHERLERTWDSPSATTPANPRQAHAYTYATRERPGALTTHELVDTAGSARRETVSLHGADGETVATTAWVGQWIIGDLTRHTPAQGKREQLRRVPLGGHGALAALTWADLYGPDATPLRATWTAGFGHVQATSTTYAAGVAGATVTTWAQEGGELVVRTTEGGVTTEVAQDAAGRVVRTRDGAGVEQRFAHDALGRLVAVETAAGRHRVAYDGYGRPARVVREGLQTIEYAYAPVTGLLAEKRLLAPDGAAAGATLTEHDGLGRATHVEHRGADGAARDYWLDHDGVGAGAGGGFVPGQLGQLSRVRGAGYERRMIADAAGRVVSTTVILGGGWREVSRDTHFRADGSERSVRLRVRDATGALRLDSVRTVEVDAHGRPSRLVVDGREIYAVTHDGEGRVAEIALGDGHTLIFDHDIATGTRRGYRVEGPTQRGGVAWERDAHGRVAAETFTADGDDARRAYAYDARGFLVTADDDEAHAAYTYDAAGLPATVVDAAGARTVGRAGAALDVGGMVYRWDALGRVIQRGDTTFRYGADGMLETATSPARTASYVHDEDGNRVLKLVDGEPSTAWVAGGVIGAQGFVEPVVVEGVTIGLLVDGELEPVLTDPRGTPVLDSLGGAYLATPYGVRASHAAHAEVLDFARLGHDADLGTVRMGVRDYDPRLGQFWTPDPLYLERPERCVTSPVECNLYGYAGNNPISFTDPSGLEKQRTEKQVATEWREKLDVVKDGGKLPGLSSIHESDFKAFVTNYTAARNGTGMTVKGEVAKFWKLVDGALATSPSFRKQFGGISGVKDSAKWPTFDAQASPDKVFVDDFRTDVVDLGDIGAFRATPRRAHPNEPTQGEQIVHIVAERMAAQGDRSQAAFDATYHPAGTAAHNAYRKERGQAAETRTDPQVDMDGNRVMYFDYADNTFAEIYVDAGGRITSIVAP